MSLEQSDFDDSSNIVIVSVDSAFAAWTKLQRFREKVLRGGNGISHRILKGILRVCERSSMRRRSV
jgi:hypothetical protein